MKLALKLNEYKIENMFVYLQKYINPIENFWVKTSPPPQSSNNYNEMNKERRNYFQNSSRLKGSFLTPRILSTRPNSFLISIVTTFSVFQEIYYLLPRIHTFILPSSLDIHNFRFPGEFLFSFKI